MSEPMDPAQDPQSPDPEEKPARGGVFRDITGVGSRLRSALLVPTLALVTALLIGGFIIAVSDPDLVRLWQDDAGKAFTDTLATVGRSYKALFDGSFGSTNAVSETLFAATPLILAGLAVAVGFQAGLFNIGAEGQMLMGGMVGLYIGFIHRAFDEATAILAGDALLTLAFQVLSRAKGIPEARIQKVIQVVSQAIGTHGMVGGQAADLKFNEKKTTLTDLNRINRLKTGALITACCEGGAIWAGATQSERLHARKYGETVGFLFQLVDDIIDGDGYASMVGKEAAFKKAATIRDKAKRELRTFGKKAETLLSFCDFLYERKH